MAGRTLMFTANVAWNLAHFRRPVIEAALRRGDRVVAVAGSDGQEDALRAMGCAFRPIGVDSKGTNPWRDRKLIGALSAALAEEKPDVMLNFTIKPVIYGSLAARRNRVPVINTITGLGTAFIAENWLTRAVEFLYRQALPPHSPVVFQNADDLALFRGRGLIRAQPVTVVQGSGVDLSAFAPAPLPQTHPFAFLLIARLLGDKGVREFVEAIRLLRAEGLDVRGQLLGPEGVENRTAISRAELEAWLREGTVDYLGATADVRPFIAGAHCIVLPSYREGMPRSLLEAAAMARPLVATDVTGCREVVQDGVNGFLCQAKSVESLGAALRKMALLQNDDLQYMAEASRRLVESRFDVKAVVQTYLDLVDRELARVAS